MSEQNEYEREEERERLKQILSHGFAELEARAEREFEQWVCDTLRTVAGMPAYLSICGGEAVSIDRQVLSMCLAYKSGAIPPHELANWLYENYHDAKPIGLPETIAELLTAIDAIPAGGLK